MDEITETKTAYKNLWDSHVDTAKKLIAAEKKLIAAEKRIDKLKHENEILNKKMSISYSKMLENDNDALKMGGEILRKEIKILELKNRTSLANNLCPDHRDKQAGKPCLACEIERLEKKK